VNTGCTIISGEYDLIAVAADLAQNICATSAPVFNDDMALKYGAPVNSNDPPITPILPLSPLCFELSSYGRRSYRIFAIYLFIKLCVIL
jgi:hypothetical protein